MTFPLVQIRHCAGFAYGDSLPGDGRVDGDVPVFGSNGPVGTHEAANTRAPAIVVGRKGSYGKLQYSESAVFAIDTTYFVDSSTTTNHLRWLYYALSTAQLDTLGQDVGVPGLNRENAYSQRIPLPPLPEQRAIADYLDTETARIDALIAKKRRMIELLGERKAILVESWIRHLARTHGELPLKHAVREITVGIVITPAAWYVVDGVPAVRGVNVSPGQVDMTDCVYISDEGHLFNRKSTIRSGDVLVVRTGQAGAAAVVPDELDGANCIDLLLIRPSGRVVPRFIEYVLNSDWTIKHIEEYSVGTIQSHFNVGALRELPVPVPTIDEQTATVQRLDGVCDRADKAMATLNRQVDLLIEHRQALITAAVTGELEIPKVA